MRPHWPRAGSQYAFSMTANGILMILFSAFKDYFFMISYLYGPYFNVCILWEGMPGWFDLMWVIFSWPLILLF